MKDRIAGVLLGLQSDIWDYLVLHLKCVNEDNHIHPAVGGINELYLRAQPPDRREMFYSKDPEARRPSSCFEIY
jgi:hypothetical protein